MDCPRCGLANTPAAKRCDCGYDLTQPAAVIDEQRDDLIRRSRMLMLGGAGLALSGVAGGVATMVFRVPLPIRGWAFVALVAIGLIMFGRAARRHSQAKIAKEESRR